MGLLCEMADIAKLRRVFEHSSDGRWCLILLVMAELSLGHGQKVFPGMSLGGGILLLQLPPIASDMRRGDVFQHGTCVLLITYCQGGGQGSCGELLEGLQDASAKKGRDSDEAGKIHLGR